MQEVRLPPRTQLSYPDSLPLSNSSFIAFSDTSELPGLELGLLVPRQGLEPRLGRSELDSWIDEIEQERRSQRKNMERAEPAPAFKMFPSRTSSLKLKSGRHESEEWSKTWKGKGKGKELDISPPATPGGSHKVRRSASAVLFSKFGTSPRRSPPPLPPPSPSKDESSTIGTSSSFSSTSYDMVEPPPVPLPAPPPRPPPPQRPRLSSRSAPSSRRPSLAPTTTSFQGNSSPDYSPSPSPLALLPEGVDFFAGPPSVTLEFNKRTGTYVPTTGSTIDELVESLGTRGVGFTEKERKVEEAKKLGEQLRVATSSRPPRGKYRAKTNPNKSGPAPEKMAVESLGGGGPSQKPPNRPPPPPSVVTNGRPSSPTILPSELENQPSFMTGAPSIDDIVRAYTNSRVVDTYPIPSPRPSPTRTPPRSPDNSTSSPEVITAPLRLSSRSRSANPLTTPTTAPPLAKTRIKSIDEIIREHGGNLTPVKRTPTPTPAQALAAEARSRGYVSEHSSDSDSVVEEISTSQRIALETSSSPSLATAFTPPSQSSVPLPRDDSFDDYSLRSSHSQKSTPKANSVTPNTFASELEVATLLKSPRLTRLITLRRGANAGLVVSLADVGSSTGRPVIVFLGLGCVRYLVALYDEVAEAFGLRLICLDRWGLGRTGDVPDSQRGFLEWACVVEEVADELGLTDFSIVGHSAGGSFALASALRDPSRIHGSVHLLAPWVSSDSLVGPYKLITYLPAGVLRMASAGENKLQAWRLGKPPTIVHAPVGYNHRAPISSSDLMETVESGRGDGEEKEDDDWDGASVASVLSGPARSEWSDRPKPRVRTSSMSVLPPNGRLAINGKIVRTQSSKSNFLSGMFNSDPTESDEAHINGSTKTLSPSPSLKRASFYGTPSSPSLLSVPSTETRRSVSNPSTLATSPSLSSLRTTTSPASNLSGNDLAHGLLRASHSESLRGSTGDLMFILERTSKPWGFKFSDVKTKVKIWHGLQDERIKVSSSRWLRSQLADCELFEIAGDHSLMTNGRVVLEVLESICAEWD